MIKFGGPLREPGRVRPDGPLGVANFRRFAVAGLVSNVGTWMQFIAQSWMALLLTGSGAAVGLVFGLQFLPTLLLAPIVGVLLDRWDLRRLIIAAQIAMVVASIAIALLAIADSLALWHLLVLITVFGTGSALDTSAKQTFVSVLVEPRHVAPAVGMNSTSYSLGRIAGPAAAGLLIEVFGSDLSACGYVVLVNAASSLVYVAILVLLDGERFQPAPRLDTVRHAVRGAIDHVRGRRDLVVVLVCVFFFACFGMNFQVALALMATEEFGRGAGEYGLLSTCLACGSLLGSLISIRRANPRVGLIIAAAGCFALSELVASLMPTYLTFAMVLPVMGLATLTAATTATAYVQLTTDPVFRGRVTALYLMVFLGTTPFGGPLVGWIGEHFGARWTLYVGSGMTAFGCLVAVLIALAGRRDRPQRFRRRLEDDAFEISLAKP